MLAGVLLPALALAGCINDISAPRQVLWEAALDAGPAQPGAEGSAAAVSRSNSTEMSVRVEGVEPGTYTWSVREGSCEAPGAVLGGEGVYPQLVAGDEAVSAEALTSALMRSGRSYHAQVREGDTGALAACGDFDQIG